MRSIGTMHRAWRFALALLLMASVAKAQEAKKSAPSATEPAPRSEQEWWMKAHEKFLDRAREGDVDLLFLGDSITQGWSNKDKEGHGPIEVWERYYAPRHPANFGIGGDRTQHVLWRITHGEIDGIKPRVAVLMIGTNNLRSNPPEEIADGIVEIVKALRERLPETKILLLGVFPRDEKPSPKREDIRTINGRIAKLDDGSMVRYLDIGKKFLADDGETLTKDVMYDFLHLTRKGYRIWADAMEPTLWEMMGEK
jgi:lysophospholipase L1-like esterase